MQQPVSQIASAPDSADCKSDQNLNSLFVNEEICYRKESIFILRCKHVYFYYKVRVFFWFFLFFNVEVWTLARCESSSTPGVQLGAEESRKSVNIGLMNHLTKTEHQMCSDFALDLLDA